MRGYRRHCARGEPSSRVGAGEVLGVISTNALGSASTSDLTSRCSPATPEPSPRCGSRRPRRPRSGLSAAVFGEQRSARPVHGHPPEYLFGRRRSTPQTTTLHLVKLKCATFELPGDADGRFADLDAAEMAAIEGGGASPGGRPLHWESETIPRSLSLRTDDRHFVSSTRRARRNSQRRQIIAEVDGQRVRHLYPKAIAWGEEPYESRSCASARQKGRLRKA